MAMDEEIFRSYVPPAFEGNVKGFYDALLNNTPDLIYAFDLQYRFTYANKALLEMWGRSWNEAIGKTCLEIGYEPWHAEMHNREIDQVVATKKPIKGVVPFNGTNGRRIYEYIFNPVLGADGNVIAIAGTTRDVTERDEAEAALRRDEERQRLALEASHAFGTWNWDIQANIVDADVSFAEMFNISEEELKTKLPFEAFFKAIHPEDQARVKQNVKNCMARGGLFVDEYRLVRPNGGIRWISVRGHVQLDETGAPVKFPGAGVDVTHQHEAVEALQSSERRFRDLADSINQIIWVAQPDGHYEFWNKRWHEYTGAHPGAAYAESWREYVHPDDQERAKRRWQYSMQTGEPYEIEYRVRRKDGVYRWLLGRADCVRDSKGAIFKWYGSATDIQDLVDARQDAESANIAKSEFLATMSHEIRTPMNAVIGLSDILAMTSPLTERQRTYIDTLQVSAKSLLALINDLLDISKIEAQTMEFEAVPFDLQKLADDVQAVVSVRATEKGLSFTLKNNIAPGRGFIGDPARLRQVLLNLCANGVKFTDRGGVTLQIDAAEDAAGRPCLRLSVSDTGIGIPPEKMDVIFHKFTQADSSINRRFGGSGLGLAIAKALVEGMGGTLQAKSSSAGSRFTVELPWTPGTLAAPAAEDSALPQPAEVAAPGARILLVEDYAPNILVAQTLLEEFGYRCDVATNGQEALDFVQSTAFDAVLMDVQMHGMNGYEATRAIRAREENENLPRLPIIGLTAHALAEDRQRCLEAGMDDYISKPFRPAELQQKLRHFLIKA